MRDLVNAAIPIAEPTICGEALSSGPDCHRKIASWVALSCIMAEFTDEKTMAIPLLDRTYLMKNGEPPNAWHIYIGRYEGEQWAPARYRHHGIRQLVLPPGSSEVSSAVMNHYQVSTYTLGSLVVHAVSNTNAPLMGDFFSRFAPDGMINIWPPGQGIRKPLSKLLNDSELSFIADNFYNQMLAASRKS